MYKRARRTNLQSDWDRFKDLNRKYNKACKSAYDNYINNSVVNGDNPKRLYSFIKNKRTDNVGVSTRGTKVKPTSMIQKKLIY